MLCPELVGRGRELDRLHSRVGALAEGHGGVVVLVGEAGVGKSRLARSAVDAAVEGGVRVLAGRAVPGASPVPYRPLTEAFLAAFRSTPVPDDAALAGFGSHLGRLVPEWRVEGAGAEESPVLLGEAIVRLLGVRGGGTGTVLLLEDVHWADAETLEVVDYLADALTDAPVLCLCTSRPDGSADELIDRLQRRDPTAVVSLAPLDGGQVDRIVEACLDTTLPSADVSQFVRAHSDGNPFLVEELLAGLVASGELRQDDGRWTSAGALTPTVPASLRESIQRRLGALDPVARRVLGAAALLGRSVVWELLPGIAEVDGRAAVEGLRAAVAEQLIEVDGSDFRFRHALTREAVLHDLLPPDRRDLATRAWPAHELANPGLPGPTLELAADLAEAAGAPAAAARHLAESARRAADHGALTTAEATARRAVTLAGDDAAVSEAGDVLVRVLVAAGKPAEALAQGRALVGQLEASAAPAERVADLRIVIAHAALAGGDGAEAERHTEAARAAATATPPDPALEARLDALAASVALDQADLEAADRLSRAAVERAAATHQPEVECQALFVLGSVVRTVDGMLAALPWYERAGEVAAAAGLARLHLQARHEMALVDGVTGDLRPLHEIRDLATRYGALTTVAVMDLTLADIGLSMFDRDLCLRSATACAEASRRYGLATEPVAELWLAGAHALGGDHDAMQAAIDAALAPDPHDPRILGDLYGRVLPTSAFVDDDLDRLPALLDTMIEHVRRAPPTTSVYPGRILWALLHAVDDDEAGAAAARAEYAEAADRIGLYMYRGGVDLVDAIALGREGQADEATARWAPTYDLLTERGIAIGLVHAMMLLGARAALRDGWGDPIRWLREAEAFFGARGYDALARRCRTMLGEAGAPVPRRRGTSVVPPALRARGVTGREVDVLRLVVDGCSNKEIAAALTLSPKTVERHLSSLFTRLAVGDRKALAAEARPHLGDDDP